MDAHRKMPNGLSQTILIVDDEEMITSTISALLERVGYRVLTACNGQLALDILCGNRGCIDLVLLDLLMPEMDGESTYFCIREMLPNLPILFSSGFSKEPPGDLSRKQFCDFIAKPFTITDLHQKIQKLLNERDRLMNDPAIDCATIRCTP